MGGQLEMGRDVTKVLREANSPGRDKENLGFLSGGCQIPRSQALDRICNQWKAAKHKRRWDEKEMQQDKGRKRAGRAGGRREDSNTACPESSVAGAGQVSQEGIPRGLLRRGAGAGPPEGLFLKCVQGLRVLWGTSMGERVDSWPQLEAFHGRPGQICDQRP